VFFVFFPFLLYFFLLLYFLGVFLPFRVCSSILFVGVRVLISTIDPTFLGAGSMVVLSTRVPKGFLLVIVVLPLLAALCGHPCFLDGPDHSFDRFSGSLMVVLFCGWFKVVVWVAYPFVFS
jgi:hypothetical protein